MTDTESKPSFSERLAELERMAFQNGVRASIVMALDMNKRGYIGASQQLIDSLQKMVDKGEPMIFEWEPTETEAEAV